ncbi:hypothetical protein ACHAXA_007245 [Cyclostephanos tholiformis]|uniref:Uncharacterized protein n=1 Tax=Cyclostephanos tholiformis TaxID=382380 RepID=A0ABD3R812_9STRA
MSYPDVQVSWVRQEGPFPDDDDDKDTENSDPQQLGPFSSPTRVGEITKLHAQTEVKLKRTKQAIHIMPSDIMTDDIDIGLLREALTAKSAQTASLKTKLEEAERQVQSATKKLQCEQGEKEMLRMAKQELESQVSTLASDKEFVVTEQDLLMEEKDSVISKSLEKIEQLLEDHRQQALMVSELQGQLAEMKEEATTRAAAEDCALTLELSFGVERQEAADRLSEMKGELEATQEANTKLAGQTAFLQKKIDDITKLLTEKGLAFEEATATINALKEDALSAKSQLSAEADDLRNAKNALNERVNTLEGDLAAQWLAAKEKYQLLEIPNDDIAHLSKTNNDLNHMNEELQASLGRLT